MENDGQAGTPELRSHRDCERLTGLVYEYVAQEPTLGRQRNFAKGTFIWNRKTSHHAVYFLRRGQVAILLNDANGCEVIVRVIKPGELFGELCFCSRRNEPRENCAQAVVDSEALEIHYLDFIHYLRRQPSALETFTFSLCKRLADAEDRIEVLSYRGAEARLGRLLLQLAKAGKFAEEQNNQRPVKVLASHDDLARMAAMTRPHVSVTMSKLRARGLVNYGRGRQLTVNMQSLAGYLEQSDLESGAENRLRRGGGACP